MSCYAKIRNDDVETGTMYVHPGTMYSMLGVLLMYIKGKNPSRSADEVFLDPRM